MCLRQDQSSSVGARCEDVGPISIESIDGNEDTVEFGFAKGAI